MTFRTDDILIFSPQCPRQIFKDIKGGVGLLSPLLPDVQLEAMAVKTSLMMVVLLVVARSPLLNISSY